MDSRGDRAVLLQLISDSPQRCKPWRQRLGDLGFAVSQEVVVDGPAAAQADILLLDLGGDRRRALQRLAALRLQGEQRPLLALAAGVTPEERASALDQGADDCVSALVADAELAARLRVQARRIAAEPARRIRCGPLAFDLRERTAFLGEEPLRLSQQELALFEALIRRPGLTLSAQTLLERLAGQRDDLSVNAVQVQVCRLRHKLRHSSARIATLRGQGYSLQVDGAGDPG